MRPNRMLFIAALAAACTLISVSAVGQSKTQPVLVVNGSGQPVPTAAQGTTNVAGTVNLASGSTVNVGNLPATQNVNGSVDVGNFPPSQNVKNTSATPLFADIDQPARNPFEGLCDSNTDSSGTGSCTFPTNNGQTLVIETVTAQVVVPSGASVLALAIGPNSFPIYFLAVSKTGSDTLGNDYYSTTQLVRFYTRPGNTAAITVFTTAGASGSVVASISGHWVTP